jgi:hypothetical protein
MMALYRKGENYAKTDSNKIVACWAGLLFIKIILQGTLKNVHHSHLSKATYWRLIEM